MRVIEEDDKFDLWLKKFSDKQKTGSHDKPKGKVVDKEMFLNRTKNRLPQPGKKKTNV